MVAKTLHEEACAKTCKLEYERIPGNIKNIEKNIRARYFSLQSVNLVEVGEISLFLAQDCQL